jgi:hypothetical protein
MAGVLVDIDILYHFIKGYLPDLYDYIHELNFSDFFKNIVLNQREFL